MSRSARVTRRLLTAVPPALRVTMGLATAGVTVLRVLVLVTSLIPVFAVFVTVLGARHHGWRSGRARDDQPDSRMRVMPDRGIATQSGRLSSS
ncbi:MAG TPA: hypothetical protein VJX92_15925 [Methylomirabilota bacterium]|nr:hypothetical protein [Methylomirabilota bacterium]